MLQCIWRTPDPALGNLLHLLGRQVAARGHQRGELFITEIDATANRLCHLGIQRPVEAQGTCQLRRAHAVGIDPNSLQ